MNKRSPNIQRRSRTVKSKNRNIQYDYTIVGEEEMGCVCRSFALRRIIMLKIGKMSSGGEQTGNMLCLVEYISVNVSANTNHTLGLRTYKVGQYLMSLGGEKRPTAISQSSRSNLQLFLAKPTVPHS